MIATGNSPSEWRNINVTHPNNNGWTKTLDDGKSLRRLWVFL